MNSVVHFELPANDTKRMADFYSSAFGWKSTFLGEDMGDYVLVQTSQTNENGMPAEPGKINGGLFARTNDPAQQHPSLVIDVDDIPKAMEAVKAAGGTINSEPMMIPGIGEYVSFTDTEGNYLGMLKPVAM